MKNFYMDDFGVQPDTGTDAMPALRKLFKAVEKVPADVPVVICFRKGRYDFYPEQAWEKVFFISNHDQQMTPRKVAFLIEKRSDIMVDGQGADFVFHGNLTPFAVFHSSRVTLTGFSVDFAVPQIHQLRILQADSEQHRLLTEVVPYEKPEILGRQLFFNTDGDVENPPCSTMSFHQDGRLIYKMADRPFAPEKIVEKEDGRLELFGVPADYIPGDVLALRSWYRPGASIVLDHADDARLEKVTVHFANGMGLLAQSCCNVTLDGFQVARRGEDDCRLFTTQADATHFVDCSGKIISENGLYEGMADDAINVHGVYLSMLEKINDHCCRAAFMHEQCFGLDWGDAGDTVSLINPENMQYLSGKWHIRSITALDFKTSEIVFEESLPAELPGKLHYGLENLTRTPEVRFAHNTVRCNRARGALFSTPKEVLCEENFFDHSHGSAILLCGDCNGWFESGACRHVVIRKNHFRNCLTAEYQFTSGVISIYPEIPRLEAQTEPFHGTVIIEENLFETFPVPLLHARSTAHIEFRNNCIRMNEDFAPLFPGEKTVQLIHVSDFICSGNQPEFDDFQIDRR